MKDDRTDWVDMRVPDGTDWLEYMLNVHDPSPNQLGVMHHLALGVPRDGKWQLKLYDPNLTRAELMEPKPVEKPCCSPIIDSRA